MYEAVDAALIRTTTIPDDLVLPPWPDLTAQDLPGWRTWLRQVWALADFAGVIKAASPELSAEVERQLRSPDAGGPRTMRRLVETMVRYLLRWMTRATPFGLFAGVAPVELRTRATVRWGGEHHAVTRPDARFLDDQTELIEQRLATLRTVPVVMNSLGFARGGSWVVPGASTEDQVLDIEVDLTAPVRLVLESTRQPIVFGDLAAKLVAEAPDVPFSLIEEMLAELVAHRVLLSAVRPPMTVTNAAPYLAQYTDLPDPADQIAVDVRVDCAVTLPASVIREAENAASALARVAPALPGWSAYHQAFIERYGPGAAVPVRDLVTETGLGFPAGYRGSHQRETPTFTRRDAALVRAAQQAALDGCAEVVLDDGLITRLDAGHGLPPVPHTELRFTLTAATLVDLERGTFTLTVVSAARHAGVSVGRFLHLLDAPELGRFLRTYGALPTTMPGALPVQISGPPLSGKMTAVARTPKVLPVLPLGEYSEDADVRLDDLVVTGDARRLWLMSLSRGRPVEPLLFNAVDLPHGQQPLVRFLAEISAAWSAPCCPFTWGPAARELPFLPRIRRGRSVLRPAQWAISAAALPARSASWTDWQRAWDRIREAHKIPREVMLGADDVRIRVDLDEPAHLALLRGQLDRRQKAVLIEASGWPGWIGGRAHELVIPLAQPQPSEHRETERTVRLVGDLDHRPGLSEWLYVKLYGRGDEILARLAELVNDRVDGLSDGWWFIRYHEPEPHLRLRLPLHSPERFGPAVQRLGQWAAELHADGLLRDYTIQPYRPEEARFGNGPTLAAAEAVFAADSRAAVQRLNGDRQVATAAGLIDIANGFTRDGLRWLVEHVAHHSGPPLNRSQVAQVARSHDERLGQALTDYRRLIDRDGLDPDQVLGDLLHLHHTRMIGVDPVSERYCLRLARAVAHARLARGAV